jgi:hypothetical protein
MVLEDPGMLGVGGGLDGVLAVGEPGVLRSPDGTGWTAATSASPRIDSDDAFVWTGVAAAPWGWVAIGGTGTDPTVSITSDDGSWLLATIDDRRSANATGGSSVDAIACSTRGCLLTGSEWNAEVGRRVAWWSSDGRTWSRLPDDGPASTTRSSRIAAWGDELVLVLDDALLVSEDGSRWRRHATVPVQAGVSITNIVTSPETVLLVGRQATDESGGSYRVIAILGRVIDQ